MAGKSSRPGGKRQTRARPLNARERMFVEHYLVSDNGSEAARAAGYSNTGAAVQAHRMLKRDHIMEAIQRRRATLQVTTDEIVAGLAHEAHYAETSAARTQAWTTLAKIKGLFKDEPEDKTFTLRIEGPGVVKVEQLQPELRVEGPQVVQ